MERVSAAHKVIGQPCGVGKRSWKRKNRNMFQYMESENKSLWEATQIRWLFLFLGVTLWKNSFTVIGWYDIGCKIFMKNRRVPVHRILGFTWRKNQAGLVVRMSVTFWIHGVVSCFICEKEVGVINYKNEKSGFRHWKTD